MGWITQEDAAHNAHLIDAPIIMGNAQSCNALRRPTPSAIQPLNRDPRKAPPKHVLTTRPLFKEKIRLLLLNTNKSTKAHLITLWFLKIKIVNAASTNEFLCFVMHIFGMFVKYKPSSEKKKESSS